MKKYCLTLSLKNDPQLIREYEQHHESVWPEIIRSIKDSGIQRMEIYRYQTRLCMIMEVNDDFNFEKKNDADNGNAKVQEWETLMLKYQQPFTEAKEGEKWVFMNKIFDLTDY